AVVADAEHAAGVVFHPLEATVAATGHWLDASGAARRDAPSRAANALLVGRRDALGVVGLGPLDDALRVELAAADVDEAVVDRAIRGTAGQCLLHLAQPLAPSAAFARATGHAEQRAERGDDCGRCRLDHAPLLASILCHPLVTPHKHEDPGSPSRNQK